MPKVILTGAVVLAAVCVSGGGSLAATGRGWLSGVTQISFGCPGPAREGGPSCDPWRPFAHARFTVTADGPDGRPLASTRRVVVSDGDGRFRFRLDAGAYTLTPLPQAHTHGGTRLRVRVQAGAATRVVVRYIGFPMML
jgi:hypothetical protein